MIVKESFRLLYYHKTKDSCYFIAISNDDILD